MEQKFNDMKIRSLGEIGDRDYLYYTS